MPRRGLCSSAWESVSVRARLRRVAGYKLGTRRLGRLGVPAAPVH